MKKLLSLFVLLHTLPSLQAHYLWIESEAPTEGRVYFGEFNENLREKAGGKLDERETLQGSLSIPNHPESPLRLSKKEDHFLANFDEAEGWLLVQDLKGEVKDWSRHGIGIVKPMFYARSAIDNQMEKIQTQMPLDILPDPNDIHRLLVVFKKKPLAKAKISVYAPNLWMQELQTDDTGHVKISTPWGGRYVVEIIHKEPRTGKFQGKAYEAIRHRATFSHVY